MHGFTPLCSYFQLVWSLELIVSWMMKVWVEAVLVFVVMDLCLHCTYKDN